MLMEAFLRTKSRNHKEKDFQSLYPKNGSFYTPAKVSTRTFKRQMIKQKKRFVSPQTEKWLIFIMYNKLKNQYERGSVANKKEQQI